MSSCHVFDLLHVNPSTLMIAELQGISEDMYQVVFGEVLSELMVVFPAVEA